mmetsp:Transcript_27359/g.77378  ORF Transcript_27359/g.77378 Transcript_27359/m.77378 type:complete len:208 (+) Transcript_27359:1-624(+)
MPSRSCAATGTRSLRSSRQRLWTSLPTKPGEAKQLLIMCAVSAWLSGLWGLRPLNRGKFKMMEASTTWVLQRTSTSTMPSLHMSAASASYVWPSNTSGAMNGTVPQDLLQRAPFCCTTARSKSVSFNSRMSSLSQTIMFSGLMSRWATLAFVWMWQTALPSCSMSDRVLSKLSGRHCGPTFWRPCRRWKRFSGPRYGSRKQTCVSRW